MFIADTLPPPSPASGTRTWLAAGPPVSVVLSDDRYDWAVDNPLPAAPWGSAAVVARVPWIPSCGGCVVYPIHLCADMEVSYCSI